MFMETYAFIVAFPICHQAAGFDHSKGFFVLCDINYNISFFTSHCANLGLLLFLPFSWLVDPMLYPFSLFLKRLFILPLYIFYCVCFLVDFLGP